MFLTEGDRKKFIDGVLSKPNKDWAFHYTKLNSQLEKAVKEKRNSDLPKILLTLPKCGYESITAATRAGVITGLAGEAWTEDVEEVLILKLINEIKDEKTTVVDFITELSKIDWIKLFGSVQGEEADGLANVLAISAQKYYKYQKPNTVGYVSYEGLSTTNFYSRYSFAQQGDKIKTYINTDVATPAGGNHYEDVIVPYTSVFDALMVGNQKDLDLNKEKLPAIPYVLLVKKIRQDEIQRSVDQGMFLLDVASLFAGVGEIKAALKTPGALAKFSRLVLGGADMLSTATSMYCSGSSKNDELCAEWKKYEVYVQMGLVSASAWDLFKGAYKQSDELVSSIKAENAATDVAKAGTKWFDDLPTGLKTDIGDVNNDLGKFFANASDAERADLVAAWEVLNINGVLRKNPANLEKLSKFMKETGMDKSRLVSSFGNAKDAQKWIDMKIPESELNTIYDGIKNSPLDDLKPWTPEHKAQGWANYKSGDVEADYKTWSNQYDGNINKAGSASSGVDDYYNTLGWNCTNCKEVTTKDISILTDNGPQTFSRRHDIADKSPNVKKAIEVKEYSSGKVYYSEKSIKTQVALDAALLESKEFHSIEWVFKGCEPSKPLEDALKQAGITVTKIP